MLVGLSAVGSSDGSSAVRRTGTAAAAVSPMPTPVPPGLSMYKTISIAFSSF